MKATFDTLLESSVFLWLDNLLVEKGQGFANYSGPLTKANGPIQGPSYYAAPHRQWVYDSSIAGVQVPNGISVNGVLVPAGANLKRDFNQGAALFSTPQTQPVTAAYSYKEVNVYFTTSSEEKVLFDTKYEVNTRTFNPATRTNVADYVYPCIIIKQSAGSNKTLSFEGLAATTIPVRLIFLAHNANLYRNVCSMLRDAQETFFPIFNTNEMPFDIYNDLDKGPFDYSEAVKTIQQDSSRLAYIREVSISDFPDRVNALFEHKAFGGFIDLDVEVLRFPRSP